jgi:uncharacterized membrane protein
MTEGETAPVPIRKSPEVATITVATVLRALAAGLRDMQRAPLLSLSFGLLYAGFGWLILFLMIRMNYGSYTYPMATGFALVAPFAAGGLYEISRRLENGMAISAGAIFSSFFNKNGQAISIMAVVTTFSYLIWLDIAAAIYVLFFGLKPLSLSALLDAVITTPRGMVFLAVGNLVGAALALVVFSITVVSLPLVFDRDVDFVTAMITSVKSVLANPKPMLVWCLIIGFLLALSLASLFAGLLVVFPLLGHSTWHLYRKVVRPEGTHNRTIAPQ